MATTGLESGLNKLSLIQDSYPQVQDADEDPVKLSRAIFSDVEYAGTDKTEIEQWLITASHIAAPSEDDAKTAERLSSLNTHLSARTTLLGSKPSVADVAMYARLAPVVKEWSEEQRTGEQGYHHIVRWLDFVQNAPLFGLKIAENEKVKIDPGKVVSYPKPVDQKAERERKKKEKAALAAAGADTAAAAPGGTVTTAASNDAKETENAKPKKEKSKDLGDKIANAVGAEVGGVEKKEKKQKQSKPQKTAPAAGAEKPLSPALIDLRVGHILKAINHPDADSLYVSTIACGDPPGTEHTSTYEGQTVRTVCSGLNGLIPLSEMQNRKIIAVCNLKPVKMRGIQSAAMVLAASPRLAPGETDNHAGPVELVNPPEGAEAGERVFFEGWEGEPEGVLNPKKKVWEMCQVGFTTTEGREVGFDAGAVESLKGSGKEGVAILKTKQGVCTVESLKGATVR